MVNSLSGHWKFFLSISMDIYISPLMRLLCYVRLISCPEKLQHTTGAFTMFQENVTIPYDTCTMSRETFTRPKYPCIMSWGTYIMSMET
jgi:hypothetical protein